MASRKEQKERARAARLLAEAEASAARRRTRRMWQWAAGLSLAVVAAIAVAILLQPGKKVGSQGMTPAAARTSLPGLQDSLPPWPPEYSSLETRLAELSLPESGNGAYHIHVLLTVYADGKAVEIPADVGLPPGSESMSPIHTHDTSGKIHVEASRQYPFVLGDIFAVWGVPFNKSKLGGYTGSNEITVFVNGKPVGDRESLKIKDLDNIVVAFGSTDGVATEPDASALQES